jgi:hypothetical protein
MKGAAIDAMASIRNVGEMERMARPKVVRICSFRAFLSGIFSPNSIHHTILEHNPFASMRK